MGKKVDEIVKSIITSVKSAKTDSLDYKCRGNYIQNEKKILVLIRGSVFPGA